MTEPSTPTRAPNAEDIPSWPDGAWAHLGEVWRRDFDWKSDDYEVVLLKDTVPLRKLVILDELSSPRRPLARRRRPFTPRQPSDATVNAGSVSGGDHDQFLSGAASRRRGADGCHTGPFPP
ncbi:hypothetical protein C8J34_10937 [Rhizobium sp. PP-F2F-G36]|nr:hypothetical protein C8J34_10937 [Rhizobium sp. PP-F2F-G36]